MSIVKRNNVVFPSLMNEILRPDWFGGMDSFNHNTPAVNVKENETGFELEMAIPGRKKEDFKVEIDNEVLTISSEVETEDTKNEDNYTRREFSFSSFKRVFTLPETVNLDKIDASYEDGILKFVMPKKEEALPKPKRAITVA
ncbi:Hsp20/alpha crystallin family protein [Arenibacter certesii]|uniref:Heat-shock protein n=1 Tax=Arenibacter certesii TaxID=228955 RepID=A0A918MJ46_9FLAO|nr:Hsp20/alpha crystallin family protein [Arenibacter certesii]GGW26900.1 heat-shock protein [Arenibacter certesii]